MNLLKENEEKRSRKEERENQQQQRLATPSSSCPVDNSVENQQLSAARQHAYRRGILEVDIEECAAAVGMNADEVNGWLLYMESVGWKFTTGGKVNGLNFRRSLRMWHKVNEQIEERKSRREENRREHRRAQMEREDERRKEAARQKFDALRAKAEEDPKVWTLCRERCANAKECGGCEKCHKIPPALIPPRGFPPEECVDFKAKEVA